MPSRNWSTSGDLKGPETDANADSITAVVALALGMVAAGFADDSVSDDLEADAGRIAQGAVDALRLIGRATCAGSPSRPAEPRDLAGQRGEAAIDAVARVSCIASIDASRR